MLHHSILIFKFSHFFNSILPSTFSLVLSVCVLMYDFFLSMIMITAKPEKLEWLIIQKLTHSRLWKQKVKVRVWDSAVYQWFLLLWVLLFKQLNATKLSYILHKAEFFFPDMMLDYDEIDIKDEPLCSSSKDNMVRYVRFSLNILYLRAIRCIFIYNPYLE